MTRLGRRAPGEKQRARREVGRVSRLVCCVLLALCGAMRQAKAQLASNFYNITGIESRALPNAVQITVRCDGAPQFGTDLSDFVDFSSGFSPKPTTRLRMRFVGAKNLVPSFNAIGLYPVDAAIVTPGRSDFTSPYFESDQGDPDTRFDVELRFDVPLLVRGFAPGDDSGIRFSDYLGPREARVARGSDNTSVVITIFTDRADARAAQNLKRVTPEEWKHRLSVRLLPGVVAQGSAEPRGASTARVRLSVLHSPLSEVLRAVSEATGVALLAADEAAGDDLSLLMPDVSVAGLLSALQNGRGYAVAGLPGAEGGTNAGATGFVVGRGGAMAETERIALRYLRPDAARLLFPDFLLPLLRADLESNALIVSAPPALIARVRRDIARLDVPRAQVRITARVYEVIDRAEVRRALAIGGAGGIPRLAGDVSAGTVSFTMERGAARAFTARLELLREKSQARLRSQSYITVAAGETGTLFSGQNRFVQVLRNRYGAQEAGVEELEVGLSLRAHPIVATADGITLDLSPRLSTVDSVEPGTNLPTLGVREATSTVRLREGELALIAGLDSDLDFKARRALGLGGERSREKTTLLMLVSATEVTSDK